MSTLDYSEGGLVAGRARMQTLDFSETRPVVPKLPDFRPLASGEARSVRAHSPAACTKATEPTTRVLLDDPTDPRERAEQTVRYLLVDEPCASPALPRLRPSLARWVLALLTWGTIVLAFGATTRFG